MQNANPSFEVLKSLIETADLPDLGPAPRASRLPLAALNRELDRFIQETNLSSALQPCVRSAALLWHDYLDESHTIAQNIDNANGSFLHAVMHRREPDYNNAKYWFHRLGRHRSYLQIAGGAKRLLDAEGKMELASRLVPNGEWNPFAFVDACETALQPAAPAAIGRILREIQALEFDALLAHIFPRP